MRLRVVLLATVCMASVVHAHPGSHDASVSQASKAAPPPTAIAGPKERAARAYFSDRKLLNQRGEEVAFFSDVLQGKVVLVNFIFTQCQDACSLQSFKLSQTQSLLGVSMGRDMHFVSLSVDPGRDTPEVLNRYAGLFNAGAGWTFLTGDKEAVDDVLQRLGQLARVPEAHTTLFILGNVSAGRWLKLHPESTPEDLARHLRQLMLEPAARVHPAVQ